MGLTYIQVKFMNTHEVDHSIPSISLQLTLACAALKHGLWGEQCIFMSCISKLSLNLGTWVLPVAWSWFSLL